MPPFEAALKALADAVKAKKGGDDYAKALKAVNDALAAADAGAQGKADRTGRASWSRPRSRRSRSAAGEYQQAIVEGRIAKPVEYQDARGFVWQAERMIDSVAPALEKKDADALAHVRTGLAELKKAFPAADAAASPGQGSRRVLSDVSRIELAAGRLM